MSTTHRVQLAVVAFVPLLVALAFGAIFVPNAHPIVDTDVYESQADLLLDGRLVEPLEEEAREQPFFTAVLDDGMVYKYEPGTAAVAAAGRAAADRFWLGFALFYALLGPVVWALSRELTQSDAVSVVAALIVALSPVSLMQGAFTLSYVPALVLTLFACLGVLRIGRTTGWAWPLATGITLAVIPWFRMYEPPIIIGVFTVYVLAIEGRRILARLAQTAAIAAVGLVPLLVTNLAMMGSVVPPFMRHFTDDRLGFGPRRATLEGPFVEYSIRDAWNSMVDGWVYLSKWVLGGPVLLLAGLAGLVLAPRRLALLLGSLMVAVTLANALFWGTFNAVRLGTYDQVGPFYQLPVLVPVGIAAGYTLVWVYRQWRALPVIAIVVIGLVSAALLLRPGFRSLDRHQELMQTQNEQVALVEEPGLVVLDSESMLFPFRKLRNRSDDPAVLYQLGTEDEDDLPLLADNPDRTAYQMVTRLIFDPSGRLVGAAAIEPLTVGDEVVQQYHVSCGASGEPEAIRARLEGANLQPDVVTHRCPEAEITLHLDEESAQLRLGGMGSSGTVSPQATELALVVEFVDGEDQVVHTERRLIERDPDDGRLVMPGRPVVDSTIPVRGYLLLSPMPPEAGEESAR